MQNTQKHTTQNTQRTRTEIRRLCTEYPKYAKNTQLEIRRTGTKIRMKYAGYDYPPSTHENAKNTQ